MPYCCTSDVKHSFIHSGRNTSQSFTIIGPETIDRRAGHTGDKICTCGMGIQDINHYLLECPDAVNERTEMLNTIEDKVLKVEGLNPKIDTRFLLGQSDAIPNKLQSTKIHQNFFNVWRVGIENKWRSSLWASKNFSSKNFAAGAASLDICYPSEMHPSLQYLLIHFVIQYVNCHVEHVQTVGIEKLSHIVQWAAKYFCSTPSGQRKNFPDISVWTRPPPQVITNDRSLTY